MRARPLTTSAGVVAGSLNRRSIAAGRNAPTRSAAGGGVQGVGGGVRVGEGGGGGWRRGGEGSAGTQGAARSPPSPPTRPAHARLQAAHTRPAARAPPPPLPRALTVAALVAQLLARGAEHLVQRVQHVHALGGPRGARERALQQRGHRLEALGRASAGRGAWVLAGAAPEGGWRARAGPGRLGGGGQAPAHHFVVRHRERRHLLHRARARLGDAAVEQRPAAHARARAGAWAWAGVGGGRARRRRRAA